VLHRHERCGVPAAPLLSSSATPPSSLAAHAPQPLAQVNSGRARPPTTCACAHAGASNSLMDLDTNTLTPLGVAYLTHDPLSGDSPISAAQEAVRDRNLLWAPADAAAGQATSSISSPCISSPSRTSHQLSDGEAGLPWSELCEACIKHWKFSGQSVEALPAEQRHMCSTCCGLWA
jgi:hypothetical protein